MKANRKFVEGEEAVSAVIGVILMVAITVAIAATVYVYVTGIVPTTSSTTENAGVTVSESSVNKIKIVLASGGQSYPTGGYLQANIAVFINGSAPVEGAPPSTWSVGESILIGSNTSEGSPDACIDGVYGLTPATYDVTVTILDTVVFDGTVKII